MTELMTQRAQERTKGCDVLPNRCPHPDTDLRAVGVIVAEQLRGRVLTNPQRPSRKHADRALRDLVKIRRSSNEVGTDLTDISRVRGFNRRFDGASNFQQPSVVRQWEGLESITVHEELEARFSRWRIGEHRHSLWHDRLVLCETWCTGCSKTAGTSGWQTQFSPALQL